MKNESSQCALERGEKTDRGNSFLIKRNRCRRGSMTPHRYTFAIRYRIPGLELKIAKSLKLKYHSGNHLIENYILNNATERKFDSIR